MRRSKPEHAQTTWADVALVVEQWGHEYGIQIEVRILWKPTLAAGAYVEVVLREGQTVGAGAELLRMREAFPTRKAGGHAGSVLWAISSAVQSLQTLPWQWSDKMRRDAQKTS